MSVQAPEPRPAPRLARLAAFLPRRLRPVDLDGLLDRLPPVEYRAAADDDRLFEQSSIAKVLLLMLHVNQESEYLLCRQLAEHALGSVPDPGNVQSAWGQP
jgi:hypothetical protein